MRSRPLLFKTGVGLPSGMKVATFIFIWTLCVVVGHASVTWAIDIYHFLVEYKNGRIVERIFPDPPQSYCASFRGYVTRTKLIEKRHYSVDGFIRTFGEENYERLMAGCFGLGLEEEIIFNRQAQGLEIDMEALPPPDTTSARLLETWKFLEKKDIQGSREKIDPAPTRSETSKPGGLPAAVNKVPAEAAVKAKKEAMTFSTAASDKNAEDAELKPKAKEPLKQPSHPLTSPPVSAEEIVVYRFLVEYINGKMAEKCAVTPPEQYQKEYRGYVTKTALVEKKTYSKRQFEKAYGRNAHHLLIQGNFGVGDIEMIMQSRMQRGMPPRKNVLPEPGPETPKFRKKLEDSLENRNFTLQGPQ